MLKRDKLPKTKKGDLPLRCGDPDRDPYAEGADAYLAGASDTSNPYAPDSDEHLSWNDGWNSQAEL